MLFYVPFVASNSLSFYLLLLLSLRMQPAHGENNDNKRKNWTQWGKNTRKEVTTPWRDRDYRRQYSKTIN
jgi:hypothetical protein